MIELEQPRFNVGDSVYVLTRHAHWNTPTLSISVITRAIWRNDGTVAYRFADMDATDIISKVFALDDELEAKAEYLSRTESHQTRKPELD